MVIFYEVEEKSDNFYPDGRIGFIKGRKNNLEEVETTTFRTAATYFNRWATGDSYTKLTHLLGS